MVIPKEVRKRLKLLPGKKLIIKVEGDHAIVLPLPDNPRMGTPMKLCVSSEVRSGRTKASRCQRDSLSLKGAARGGAELRFPQ
jgi:AbrB family looped-hinge helix DNA binding protein